MSEDVTTRYHVRRREFLNEDPEMPGFIIGVVEDTHSISDEDPEDRRLWGTIVLDLADCARRVSFDFAMTDEVDRADSLRKINLIADVIIAVRDAIALEVESRNARPKKEAAPCAQGAVA